MRRVLAFLAGLFLVGLLTSPAPATHDPDCTTTDGINYTGTSGADDCDGHSTTEHYTMLGGQDVLKAGGSGDNGEGGGQGDILRGQAGGDQLDGDGNSSTNPDVLIGGSGDDLIEDVGVSGDFDVACDGTDDDFVNLDDEDGLDEVYLEPGDGFADDVFTDPGDTVTTAACPY